MPCRWPTCSPASRSSSCVFSATSSRQRLDEESRISALVASLERVSEEEGPGRFEELLAELAVLVRTHTAAELDPEIADVLARTSASDAEALAARLQVVDEWAPVLSQQAPADGYVALLRRAVVSFRTLDPVL